MVFVLDRHKHPLMPCSEKRARLLLSRRLAVIHRFEPFKHRSTQASQLQPVVLKLDPGSKTTGIALVREEVTEAGRFHHALHLAHLEHRGEQVHQSLVQRKGYRRRRRAANLRYRAPRFLNRRRAPGWLPPSFQSRVDNVLHWSQRYQRLAPLRRIEVEDVKFDTQLLQNPSISGREYQRGTLAGWEVRSYLLEKWQRRCAYCASRNVPFELDHIQPRSRGGSSAISNLVLACHACNAAKGDRTAAEFGHPEIAAQATLPLQDVAAVNATRRALVKALGHLGLPIGTWSGGQTCWNRERFGVVKMHALDALCVGALAGVEAGSLRTLRVSAQGRGRYGRTLVNDSASLVAISCDRNGCAAFRRATWCERRCPASSKPEGCIRAEWQCEQVGRFGWARWMGSTPSIAGCCNPAMAIATAWWTCRQQRCHLASPPKRAPLSSPRWKSRGIQRRWFDEEAAVEVLKIPKA